MDNLKLAHKNAKRGKGWYSEVKMVDSDTEKYLGMIQEMLVNHTYKTSKYTKFIKNDSGKDRTVYKLPYFPDRITQWAIIQVIEPYLIRNFTADTYSAIPGRGIHYGMNRVKLDLNDRHGCRYCLKLDVRHYYQSINHSVLKKKFRKIFKDGELLWILDEIIDSINTVDVDELSQYYSEDIDVSTGIPIGNYLSQYCGNFYLSEFDHWIKEVKHIKYYHRYMDDIVILHESKEYLHELLKDISEYFESKLKLHIKPNWQVFLTYDRGVDFIGYRFFFGYTLLRKNTCKKMKKSMIKIKHRYKTTKTISYSDNCSIQSYKGWLVHCNSFRLYNKYILPVEGGYNKNGKYFRRL